ncbi:MAG: InlB B-repeat-containing protein [Peptococcaceae bacterium]|jgi:hypothetical protein|nr:InlB B-repeat-containing protein [Peptococcaceae bacterium]
MKTKLKLAALILVVLLTALVAAPALADDVTVTTYYALGLALENAQSGDVVTFAYRPFPVNPTPDYKLVDMVVGADVTLVITNSFTNNYKLDNFGTILHEGGVFVNNNATTWTDMSNHVTYYLEDGIFNNYGTFINSSTSAINDRTVNNYYVINNYGVFDSKLMNGISPKGTFTQYYKVTFDADGGAMDVGDLIWVAEGGAAEQPDNPVRSGYNFIGWYLEDALYDFGTPVIGDVSLQARYELAAPLYTIYPEAGTPFAQNDDGIDVISANSFWLVMTGQEGQSCTAYINGSYKDQFWINGPYSPGYLQFATPYPYPEGIYHLIIRDSYSNVELISYDFIVCRHTAETQRIVTLEPTCEESGISDDYCSYCGLLLSAGIEIPALGHIEVTMRVEPTCTDPGFVRVTCSVCGEELSYDFIQARGHEYDEVVYTLPTKEADGYWTYTCSRCGDWYTVIDEGTMIVIIGISADAYIEKLNGNKNSLTVTVTEYWSDGSETYVYETVSIDKNSAGTYQAGGYRVYVDTKGNDQIRACYIVW